VCWRWAAVGRLTLAQPPPQPASDLVDGVEVRHVEDVGALWLGRDLLQLHLQRLPDAHGENPDAGFGGRLGGLQDVILASAVREEDGDPLDASGRRPGAAALREDVGGGVADGVPGHRVSTQVAYVAGGSFHLLQGPVSTQGELGAGSVTVPDHGDPRLVRRHVERLHDVGHPLPDLLKVLLSNTGRRIQDKRQVVVDIFTSCREKIQEELVTNAVHMSSGECNVRSDGFTCPLSFHRLAGKSQSQED